MGGGGWGVVGVGGGGDSHPTRSSSSGKKRLFPSTLITQLHNIIKGAFRAISHKITFHNAVI